MSPVEVGLTYDFVKIFDVELIVDIFSKTESLFSAALVQGLKLGDCCKYYCSTAAEFRSIGVV